MRFLSNRSSNEHRLLSVFFVLCLAFGFGQPASAQSLIINEVDADQVGTDSAEFVELYDGGAGNTDLSGLSLVLYNGSDDLSYLAFDLDGQSTNANGYFVLCGNAANTANCDLDVSPDTNLIQNGEDAVALLVGDAVNFPNDTALPADGDIVDAIVYETGSDSNSGLLVLLNAGQAVVNEGGGGDQTGQSNQRCANGSGGARNTNTYTQATPTPGADNNCGAPSTPNVLINEVDADQVGTDSAEFVELYDGGAGNTDLSGLSLVLYNGSDNLSYLAFDLDGQSTDANGYFVLCGNAATTANCDLDVSPDTNLIQNGEDAVALLVGDAVNFPNDTALPADGDIVDAIVYETGSDSNSGLLVLLNAGQAVVNEGGGGDQTGQSNQRCANGSGGARNTNTYTQATPTPGADNNCPAPSTPDILINEVDADQVSTDGAEFIELYDGGVGNTDLTGLSLVLYNGSDNLSYLAFDLDGQSTDANGYFVLCGDATNTANCDLDVTPNTNLIQNGEDAVALLVGDAVNFPNDTALPLDGDIVDAIVYETGSDTNTGLLVLLNAGQAVVNEGGGGDQTAHSNQRCENGAGGARNTSSYGQFLPTPGEENTCGTGGPAFGVCGEAATMIYDVQGNGLVSPLNGTVGVVLEAVVVADFQANNQLLGFFLQEEATDADADPGTSDGIFVFDNGFADVAVGDVVRVQGNVTEFFGLTELNNVSNLSVCAPGILPAPAIVDLPVTTVDDFERWEGMLITVPATLYVSGNFTLGRFGEVDLSVGAPLDNPTNVAAPGPDAAAVNDLNDRSRIQLDDGSNVQNPLPLPPYLGDGGTLRTGDSIAGLTAVLSYSFGSYELHPVDAVSFTRVNTRQAPPDVGGAIRVASFNVLNYFTTLDDSGPICGPDSTLGCRGADTADEFMRQRAKLVAAISKLDAHVVGLIEVENHPFDVPITDLVNALNAVAGAGTYDFISTLAIGDDAIRAGLIYQSAVVTPVHSFEVLDASVDPLFNDQRNRPVLAQSFHENSSEAVFTVAVNHLKSKGSACADIGDPDIGDGQGNCNATRTAAAVALVDWLATDPTGSGSHDFLILGDLNAYAQEDPVTMIESAGYIDLIEAFVGTGVANGAYTFNFFAESGSLDHALSSLSMTANVTGAAIWHVNADEPSALDYNNFNQPDLYNPDEFRSSDHDPLVVGLFGDADGDGVLDVVDAHPNSDLSPTVVVNGCDSGVTNTVLPSGSSIADLVTDAFNAGGKKAVKRLVKNLKRHHILSKREARAIMRCASKKAHRHHRHHDSDSDSDSDSD